MRIYKNYNTIIYATLIILVSLFFTPTPTAHADVWWAKPGQGFRVLFNGKYSTCSVGWPAWDNQGNHYIITAAHCFREDNGQHRVDSDGINGLNIYNTDDTDFEYPIGWEAIWPLLSSPHFIDASLVKFWPGRSLTGPGWDNVPNTPHEAVVGETACNIGARHSKSSCGTVTAVRIPYKQYEASSSYQRVDKANYCAWAGDSGGAVYNSNGALGIENAGGTYDTCYHGHEEFTPILDILRMFRETIPSLTIN